MTSLSDFALSIAQAMQRAAGSAALKSHDVLLDTHVGLTDVGATGGVSVKALAECADCRLVEGVMRDLSDLLVAQVKKLAAGRHIAFATEYTPSDDASEVATAEAGNVTVILSRFETNPEHIIFQARAAVALSN